MANEITFSGISDQRVASRLAAEALLIRTDRNQLPNHPALFYAGDLSKTGTAAVKVPFIGHAYDLPTSVADGSQSTNTAYTDASYTVTIAPYRKQYQTTDLARLTDSIGNIDPAAFAQDAEITSGMLLLDLVCNVGDDFAATVGSTGVNATLETFMEAKATLDAANVPGPYLAVLHTRQWNDIVEDMTLAGGGASVYAPAAQEAVALWGTGYKGKLHGVDVFVTNRVPTKNAGADRGGCMFGRGAIIWADGVPTVDDPINQMIVGRALFERSRDQSYSLTGMHTARFVGVSIADDAAGVAIITDA